MVVAVVGIVVSLALTGLARWVLFGGGGSEASDGGGGDQVVWEVDACVMPVGGVTTTRPTLPPDVEVPPEVPPEVQEMREGTPEVEPVACSDDRAIARITHMGATVDTGIGELGLTDDGCPDDTDAAFIAETSNSLGLESRIACTRNLEPPHPGDPGGGGGHLVVGDCVLVSTSPELASDVASDRIQEQACDAPEGYFAAIVALVADPAECPEEALSRFPAPQDENELLCLAPDGDVSTGGLMAPPGGCIAIHFGSETLPPEPVDCAAPVPSGYVFRFVSFAGPSGVCPSGGELRAATGYDRELCLELLDLR